MVMHVIALAVHGFVATDKKVVGFLGFLQCLLVVMTAMCVYGVGEFLLMAEVGMLVCLHCLNCLLFPVLPRRLSWPNSR